MKDALRGDINSLGLGWVVRNELIKVKRDVSEGEIKARTQRGGPTFLTTGIDETFKSVLVGGQAERGANLLTEHSNKVLCVIGSVDGNSRMPQSENLVAKSSVLSQWKCIE